MIHQKLHRQPQALDSSQHGGLRVNLPVTDWSVAKDLNAIFVAAVEFGDVCREFPIVFVRAGKEPDGSDAIAPVAVFGLQQDDNLYVENGAWRAQYMPAALRCFPFGIARMNEEQFAVCVDMAWSGTNPSEGTRLFNDLGQPSELLGEMTKHLETLEAEVQRTRFVGQRLKELDLLRDMRFDATLPDGRTHTVDGFMTIDDQKVQDLPAETVMELHKNGLLSLFHAHWISMGNMRKLVDWYAHRSGSVAAAVAQAQAAEAANAPQA